MFKKFRRALVAVMAAGLLLGAAADSVEAQRVYARGGYYRHPHPRYVTPYRQYYVTRPYRYYRVPRFYAPYPYHAYPGYGYRYPGYYYGGYDPYYGYPYSGSGFGFSFGWY